MSQDRAVRNLAMLGCFLLAGCATSLPVTKPTTDVMHVYEKNFSLNAEQTIAVGQPIVRVKDYYLEKTARNAWEAKVPFEVPTLFANLKFHAGIFPVDGRKEVQGEVYDLVHLTPYNGGTLPYLVDPSGKIAKVMNAVEMAATDVAVLPPDFKMSRGVDVKINSTKGYSNFELIYTGQSSGTTHVSYREYSSEDLARTAFFQDLTYDSKQSMIRFRDIAIQIISSTNERMTYKVVEFPQASRDGSGEARLQP